MKKLFVLLLLGLLCVSSVFATQVGVNYYHETMITKEGYKYIPRTTSQVSSDLDSIKTITSYVKLYMNPLVGVNQAWLNQVNSMAKGKGMYTVVVMNTEDRTLNSNNWASYTSAVLNNCQYFNGKANELVVGNEISLHSTFSKTEIRTKVESLIVNCKKTFNGPVSYEAFFYEKDAWVGYTGRLYFNTYENLNSFTTNVKELHTKFPTASIGEWGEDLLDGSIKKDETWQKQETLKRLNVIKSQNIPVAYIFTYKEPSTTGFGLVRMDGTKRPVWDVLKTNATITPPPATTITLPTSGCTDYTKSGTMVMICNKGSNKYEMYLRTYSGTDFCYKTYCVGKNTGFISFTG